MKKILIILLVFISFSLPIFADEALTSSNFSMAHGQYLMGYVNSSTNFNVEILEYVLPFDIESDLVKINTNLSIVEGLKIGTYNLVVNTDSFNLTVSHDKFKRDGDISFNNTNSVDYRLDMFYVDINGDDKFKTCFSDNNFVLSQADGNSTTNRSIYVSMNATPEELSALLTGNYTSTITFDFEVGV